LKESGERGFCNNNKRKKEKKKENERKNEIGRKIYYF